MKKIQTSDLFNALRIVKESGIKDDIAKLIRQYSDGQEHDVKSVGINGVLSIVDAMASAGAEREIYKFLAALAETEPDAIKDMEIGDFVTLLEEIGKENDIPAFFTRLSGLITLKQ